MNEQSPVSSTQSPKAGPDSGSQTNRGSTAKLGPLAGQVMAGVLTPASDDRWAVWNAQEFEARNRARWVAYEATGVPDLHRGRKLHIDGVFAPWWPMVKNVQSRLGSGSGAVIVLLGTQGCGKTQAAAWLARELIRARFLDAYPEVAWVKYLRLTELVTMMLEPSRFGGEKKLERLDPYCSPPLLILDDANEVNPVSWKEDWPVQLVDVRVGKKRDTFILSNMEVDEFRRTIHPNILDRTKQWPGGVINCDWGSFREALR